MSHEDYKFRRNSLRQMCVLASANHLAIINMRCQVCISSPAEKFSNKVSIAFLATERVLSKPVELSVFINTFSLPLSLSLSVALLASKRVRIEFLELSVYFVYWAVFYVYKNLPANLASILFSNYKILFFGRIMREISTSEENPALSLHFKYCLRMWRKPLDNS